MSRARWRALLAIALGCSALSVSVARADYRPRVVILAASSEQESGGSELLARLRGELTASGLEVVLVPAPDGVDLRDAVETSARELDPSAVIAVRYVPAVLPEQATAEVWISDRHSHRTLVQRGALGAAGSNQTVRLAVQVAELFKARLASLWVEPAPVVLPPKEPVAKSAPPPPPPPRPLSELRPRVLVGAGLGMLHHFEGDVSAWLPSFQIGYEVLSEHWVALALRASGAWTPGEVVLRHDSGAANISQTLLFANATLRLVPDSIVQPTLSVGSGVFSVRVEGQSDVAAALHTERTWSGASSVGLGVWVEPTKGLAWTLEGQGLAAWSKTLVRIHGDRVATLGFPSALLSIALIGRY